jgi:hypothetical protein
MNDWKSEIVKGVLIDQRLQEVDTRGIWSYCLPEVAASRDEIAAMERDMRITLDPEYKDFLLHANGWKKFYQDVDIFGTSELSGAGLMSVAREQLDAVEPADFQENVGLAMADVLPIAASRTQTDTFLLALPGSAAPGSVIWFAGYTIERFPGFDEFYLSMLDYNRRRIQKCEAK